MKRVILHILFLIAVTALAQVASFSQNAAQKPADQPQQTDVRGNALAQLGLTMPQMQQIRRINQSRKPVMEQAQMRLRDANRALDEAIYGDSIDEAQVLARLKEFQLAQAEVGRIRFTNELAIRKVLTPEQLVKFRAIRQRFDEARQTQPLRNRRQMRNARMNGGADLRPKIPSSRPAGKIKPRP
jgi:Spy/CpxP family protein refolding chaperone